MAGIGSACTKRGGEPAKPSGEHVAIPSVSFTPEAFGPRLRQGAPEALRTKMHLGGNVQEGAIRDIGPTVNARVDALAVTAEYGGYRDDTAPCPAPWRAVIRWVGAGGQGKLWQSKVAPWRAAATSVGFVLGTDYSCFPYGTTARDTANWYVDSRGRIGQLRVTPGVPPDGVRLDAPGGPNGYYYGTTTRPRTLLADRESDRIWSVPRPDVDSPPCRWRGLLHVYRPDNWVHRRSLPHRLHRPGHDLEQTSAP